MRVFSVVVGNMPLLTDARRNLGIAYLDSGRAAKVRRLYMGGHGAKSGPPARADALGQERAQAIVARTGFAVELRADQALEGIQAASRPGLSPGNRH
jgi:hypothetical protein